MEISDDNKNHSVLPSLLWTVIFEALIQRLSLHQYHYEEFVINIDNVEPSSLSLHNLQETYYLKLSNFMSKKGFD